MASDVLFLALSVFLLTVIHKNYETPMEAVMQYQGKALPEFSYTDLKNNTEKKFTDQKNNVVILNIWATWCPPCRKEMPELDRIQKEFKDRGVAVVAISDEDPATIRNFISKKNYSFATGSFLHSNELINSINTRPVSILLIDGMVKDIVVGARGYSFFHDWADIAGSR